MTEQVIHGDSLEILKSIPDNSIDSVVTDPPYGLAFMGKDWDKFSGNRAYAEWTEQWARECLRVLKPGGHLLAFSGTRTYHALAWGVESAGFEIRDMIEWLYTSGFPKSMDVGKALDKRYNSDDDYVVNIIKQSGMTDKQIADVCGVSSALVRFWRLKQRRIQRDEWVRLCKHLNIDDGNLFLEAEREVLGYRTDGVGSDSGEGRYNWNNGKSNQSNTVQITAPATPLAQQWDGWGTALKPAHEPIVMARKPLIGTVCANVEQYGTGAINVDGCRIAWQPGEIEKWTPGRGKSKDGYKRTGELAGYHSTTPDKPFSERLSPEGRFPANCITTDDDAWYSKYFNVTPQEISKKASKADRGEGNNHPTVKPTDLMAWLVRLVTPPNGIVIDPFAGSGSTLVAAKREGFSFIGIEREQQYIDIIHKRLEGVNEWQSNQTKLSM